MNYSNHPFGYGQERVEKYELLKKIGEGANGEVYSAKRRADGLIVAVKYLNFSDSKSWRRFQNEISIYRKLEECPFIVKIVNFSLDSFKPYLVMEFCRHGNARSQMELFINNPVIGVGLLLGVADGIRHIHGLDTFHRDIKPDNLLLADDAFGNYILKLGDAGMSCFLKDSNSLFNATYSLQGTPSYIAPELFRGADFSSAADVFSFGVTCHELLTGVRPIAGQKVSRGPAELKNLIERMIDIEPNKRPTIHQTVNEMRAVFNQMKSNQILSDLGERLLKVGAIFGSAFIGIKILEDLFGEE